MGNGTPQQALTARFCPAAASPVSAVKERDAGATASAFAVPTVRFTGTTRGGMPAAEIVTLDAYVPGASPEEFTVAVSITLAPPAVPWAGDTVSQGAALVA